MTRHLHLSSSLLHLLLLLLDKRETPSLATSHCRHTGSRAASRKTATREEEEKKTEKQERGNQTEKDTKYILQQRISCLKECHLELNTERERVEQRAECRAGVCKRGKVGVQLGPIRAGPHAPAGVRWWTEGAGGSREGSGEEVLRAMGLDPV